MLIYLLHFEPPVSHARHYLGSTPDHGLSRRMQEHASGRGAKLTSVAAARGVQMTLARIWHAPDRTLERRMKAAGHLKAHCPVCQRGETDNPVLTASHDAASRVGFRPVTWAVQPG